MIRSSRVMPRQRVLDARPAVRPLAVEAVVGGGHGQARAQREVVLGPAAHHAGEQRVADDRQRRQPSHEHEKELRRPAHRVRFLSQSVRVRGRHGHAMVGCPRMVCYTCRMPLADLGLIGNCQLAAHVRRDGAIVWCCMPRFDSAPIFGALLDDDGGQFTIGPATPGLGVQRYLANTNVLETRFESPEGAFRVLDFAPRFLQYERSFRPTKLVRVDRAAGRHAADPGLVRSGARVVEGPAAPRVRLATTSAIAAIRPRSASPPTRRCRISTASPSP